MRDADLLVPGVLLAGVGVLLAGSALAQVKAPEGGADRDLEVRQRDQGKLGTTMALGTLCLLAGAGLVASATGIGGVRA